MYRTSNVEGEVQPMPRLRAGPTVALPNPAGLDTTMKGQRPRHLHLRQITHPTRRQNAEGSHGHQAVHRDLQAEGCLLYVLPIHHHRIVSQRGGIYTMAAHTNRICTAARIKKNKKVGNATQTKFKVRCHRHLYTLVLKDSDKAEKLKQSLPPSTYDPHSPYNTSHTITGRSEESDTKADIWSNSYQACRSARRPRRTPRASGLRSHECEQDGGEDIAGVMEEVWL